MADYAALIGIDWADRKHDICLLDPTTGGREASILGHSPKTIDEWATALRSRFGGRQLAVCLEQSRGPLIYSLMKYNFLTLYPVNPSTLARYRKAFSPSHHKDDPTDDAYLAELLTHHRDHLRTWHPDSEQTRTLRYLVEHRRRLVDDRTRISNRMTSLLKCYFPQILEWFPDIRTTLVCDFLLRWPSLDALRRVRRGTLIGFLRSTTRSDVRPSRSEWRRSKRPCRW
ncbi:MAG TPA: IS110 family transposase [Pyrinomonadaceae bacterium]|jgi:ribosomal protein S15P/S13E|nr:IS110 family transposase [Pyrinomonadaceae bacterium]